MPRTQDGFLFDGKEVTAGLTTAAVVESSDAQSIKSSYDVIVIGAGFCGLVAARDLARDKDISVLLVEARDRIGGRTWTANELGEDFEMGGTWVHWCQPHVYSEAHHHGLHKTLKTSTGTAVQEQVFFKPKNSTEIKSFDVAESLARLQRTADAFFNIDGMTAWELMPYPRDSDRPQPWTNYDDLSVRDRLNQTELSEEDKEEFEAHMNILGSGTAADTAFTEVLRWYALLGYNMQSFWSAAATFKFGDGGMTNFARHILAEYKGDKLFKKAVKSVNQESEAKVVVSCTDGSQYSAKWVVCTIPLNCLSDIHFDPPFTSLRQEALNKGHMNVGPKVHFVVDEIQPNWFCNTADDTNCDFIIAFVDHKDSKSAERSNTYCVAFGYNDRLTDPTKHDKMISEFKKLHPDGNVKSYLTHAWAKDPFSKGVWYCASPGMTNKYLQELQKPHGRVIMASADWASGSRGYVDGAIEMGASASSQLARVMSNS